VDIPLTAATIFGVEDRKYTLVTLEVYGKFNDLAKDPQTIGDEFFRRCECCSILAAVVPCMHVHAVKNFDRLNTRAHAGCPTTWAPSALIARRSSLYSTT
jgi:hypothetical protein